MLHMLANMGVFFVALLHIAFCIIEMYFWQRPLGLKLFHIDAAFAKQSAVLAANQGLYNGFLSAGLCWGLLTENITESFHIKLFFLSCVIIAGCYAGITSHRRIIYVQALPAFITLLLVIFS